MEPRTWVLMAFLAVTVLTAFAVLGAAVGWLPKAAPQLITWGIPAVLGEIAATVVVFFKGQWGQNLRINIVFEGEDPTNIVLEAAKCTYVVYDNAGQLVREGNIGPALGHGGWQIELPGSVQANHSVALSLRSQAAEAWHVRPFLPLVQTQVAHRIEPQ